MLANIGVIHRLKGKNDRAMETLRQSLQISREIDYKAGIAEATIGIANIHVMQGQYAQALELYQQNLEVRRSLNDRSGVANVLTNIGVVERRLGRDDRALASYQQALEIHESLKDKGGIAGATNNLGNIHLDRGRYDEALASFQTTLRITEEINDRAGISLAAYNIGGVQILQTQYEGAAGSFERAVAVGRRIGRPDLIFNGLTGAGFAYTRLGRFDQARRALEEAIAIAEDLRKRAAGGEQQTQGLFQERIKAYTTMVDLLIARNKPAEALGYAESAKARVLLEVLRAGRINLTKAMTSREQEEEAGLRAQLVALNSQLFRERQRGKPVAQLEAQRARAQAALEDFQTGLYLAHPELKVKRGEAAPLTLPEAASLAPDERTALLEFVVAEDKTTLFVLSKSSGASPDLRVFTIPIREKDLGARVANFRKNLAEGNIAIRDEAVALYDLLLKPAQAVLKGKSSLVIVPDGPVWELPLQALMSGSRFLIEDASIAYAPSLTYLREMNRKRAPARQMTLLAMGDPALAEQTRAKAPTRGGPLGQLPYAREEAIAIGALHGAARSKVYTGAEAREERFKAEAGRYRILHLAAHGVLDNADPMSSYVLLSQSVAGGTEDGLLEAREIMNLDLQADLAVLSACETARGRVGAGEGVIGLSWALFVAGVPATVVTQWSVNDANARDLIVEFHRQLKTRPAQDKAESLRQAALKVMRTQRHPQAWAGFILVGDGR